MPIQFPAAIELNVNNNTERFQLNFSICRNPDCECSGVNMVLYNENKEIQFFLDFTTESYLENNHSDEDIRILNLFINFLKSEKNSSLNLAFFKENYEYIKENVNRRRDAMKSFEPGTFLLYRKILWEEEDIKINFDGKSYFIFDGYCVTSNCNCQDVALNFIEDVHKLGIREADFYFVYNYITGVYRNPTRISEDRIKGIISIIPESLNAKFKKRNTKLKKEVKKDIERKIKEEGLFDAGKRKLGRNEPCHCGSGKKYKKCCLDKDIEKYGKAIKVDINE